MLSCGKENAVTQWGELLLLSLLVVVVELVVVLLRLLLVLLVLWCYVRDTCSCLRSIINVCAYFESEDEGGLSGQLG